MENEQQYEAQRGIPVDLTKEEYVDYYMTIAKMFGTLRIQKPSMILFGVYAAVSLVFTVMTYIETGVLDWLMLAVLFVTLISAGLTYYLMPARMRRKAKELYDAGNVNGYYGELLVNRLEVTKLVGEGEDVTVPLTEQSVFLENERFMALFGVASQKAIILPSRCVTPDMAKTIREAVFSAGSRIHRRVVGRMAAGASVPVARRDLLSPAVTEYACEVEYTADEIKQQIKETGNNQFADSLPTVCLFALLIGTMTAMLQESVLWFFAAALATVIAMLLISLFSSSSKAKRAAAMAQNSHVRFAFNERGVTITTRGQDRKVFLRWNTLAYITEKPDRVELSGMGQVLYIPKRHIEDMNALSAVVDAHYQPKSVKNSK